MCGCNSTSSPSTTYTFTQRGSYDCGCTNSVSLYDCSGSTCPINLDATCIIYHKFNNAVTALTNLNISNGATLDLILTSIDGYIGQLKVTTADLPYLRQFYVANNLIQFTEAVDQELSDINDRIDALDPVNTTVDGYLGELSSDPGAAINGNYWYNTTSGKIKMKVNGVVKILATE